MQVHQAAHGESHAALRRFERQPITLSDAATAGEGSREYDGAGEEHAEILDPLPVGHTVNAGGRRVDQVEAVNRERFPTAVGDEGGRADHGHDQRHSRHRGRRGDALGERHPVSGGDLEIGAARDGAHDLGEGRQDRPVFEVDRADPRHAQRECDDGEREPSPVTA